MGGILYGILQLYFIVLIGRLVVSWIWTFNPSFRPTGAMAVAVDTIYRLTDPILKPLQRIIPPLRIGNFMLDLSLLIVFVLLQVLAGVVSSNL